MNIVIFSGGSGSIQLQNGLKKIAPHCKITNIINIYDDGKSTGIARKVCDVLGPSDLRKNHYVQYKNSKNPKNQNILDFYEKRFEIPNENSDEFVLTKLSEWNLSQFEKYVPVFFSLALQKNITDFSDFSIANIIYATMFREIGYEKTNEYFKNFLNIEDNILINSYENYVLRGITESGKELLDEGSIVDHKNPNDPISNVYFYKDGKKFNEYENLNIEILKTLREADLVVYSSGTQWSSLIPTYLNNKIKKVLDSISYKTIFVINNQEDKDMFGVNSQKLVSIVEKYINLQETKFIINTDATKIMSEEIPNKKCYFYSMENNNGKHNPEKLAKAIFKTFFDINKNFDSLFVDFDDTLYSRNEDDIEISIENCKIFNDLNDKIYKKVIISGNGYKPIQNKLSQIFGSDLNVNFDIWADGGIVKYKNNLVIDKIDNLKIQNLEKIVNVFDELGLRNKIDLRGPQDFITCVNIKPLNELERTLLSKYLNLIFEQQNENLVAQITGTTSVDIVHKDLNKKFAFMKYSSNGSLFIGDECECGNDKEVSLICENYVQVKNVYDMNIILKLLMEC